MNRRKNYMPLILRMPGHKNVYRNYIIFCRNFFIDRWKIKISHNTGFCQITFCLVSGPYKDFVDGFTQTDFVAFPFAQNTFRTCLVYGNRFRDVLFTQNIFVRFQVSRRHISLRFCLRKMFRDVFRFPFYEINFVTFPFAQHLCRHVSVSRE